MAYIGRQPTVGNFQICDAISVVNGQAAYTMQVGSVNVIPQSANHMIVSLNGTIQKPNSSFTVSGSTITFASNLVTNDVIDFIQILGDVLDLGVPSDATITAAKLDSSSITGQSALTSVASDDTVLISDTSASGALKKITKANLVGTGFNPDAAQVFNESGADVDFRIESNNKSHAFFLNGGTDTVNFIADATGDQTTALLQNNSENNQLCYGGDYQNQIGARIQRVQASNNSTVDAFRFLTPSGSVYGAGYMSGYFYINCPFSANQFSAIYSVFTCGNSSATFSQINSRTRGTSPVSSVAMVADGGSGAVKLQITYINNSGVVSSSRHSLVSFVGSI